MRDGHCHIVWGVDDGASSWEESLAMLDAAQAAGVDHIFATPHMRWKGFNQSIIEQRFSQLSQEAQRRGIGMDLGFEVYYKTLLEQGLEHAPQYVRVGTNEILIEFNTGGSMPDGWEQVFYQLQTVYGLEITLAHPERYTTVLEDFEAVYRIKDMGCKVQVSAGDLYHKNSFLSRSPLRRMAQCARWILEHDLCDELVSDAHRPEHYLAFAKVVEEYI